MFKAFQIGCHLLLGDTASTLVFLLDSLILLNVVTANDIRPSHSNQIRLFKHQISTASVPDVQHVNYLPKSVEFNHQYKKIKRKDANEHVLYRLNKRDSFNSNNETSIKRTIKPDKNELQYDVQSDSGTRSPPIFLPNSTTTTGKAFVESNDQIVMTTFPSTAFGDIIRSTATNYKTTTNIGYKYGYYDRNEMRKQNRLNKESNLVSWNGLLKLIFLVLICTAGTTGNIFIISSIMVVDNFQMQGNIYIVSLALAQLLISIVAVPGTCIEIMAVIPNHPTICHLQWLLTQFTLVIILLSFMLISLENCSALRSRSLMNHNLFCTKFRIVLLVLLTWLIAGLITYTQHTYELAPALCQHELNKKTFWPQYHLTIVISVVLVPTLITIICFLRCAFRVKRINIQFENNPLENNWQLVMADGELVKANVIVYLYTFFTWAPLCILAPLSAVQQVNVDWSNAGWWVAWFNSCSYSFVYAFFNQNFNKTFFKLFFYCCCKTHLQFEGKTAINLNYQRRTTGTTTGSTNVDHGLRVHMIPGFNMNPPRRDDYLMTNTSYGSNHYNVKNQRYGTVTVGRHTRTIPASDGGLGWAEGGGGTSNYSGNLATRYGSRNYSHSNSYSSHLVDAKDYSSMYDYGQKRSFGPSNQKYYI